MQHKDQEISRACAGSADSPRSLTAAESVPSATATERRLMQQAIDALRKEGRAYGAKRSTAAGLISVTLFNAARTVEELMLAGCVDAPIEAQSPSAGRESVVPTPDGDPRAGDPKATGHV